MGNFHCIIEGCGRVVYRPYLPPVVRWRYPGEDWQEIEGDDYSIDELPAQCCGTWDITVEYDVPGCNGGLTYSGTRTVRIPYGKYRRLEYSLDNPFVRTNIAVIYWDCRQNKEKSVSVWSSTGKSSTIPDCGDPEAIHNQVDSTYQVTEVNRADQGQDNCNKCSFTIYKNQQIVHSEEREECPEAEVLTCRLSNTSKEIKVEKTNFVERIKVIKKNDFEADFIPKECWNIYVGFSYISTAEGLSTDKFIAQICSAPGCPPQEYEVICGCESCEECPPDTCPVLCNGVICCHEKTTGKAIKSIPLDQYCGEIN